MIKVNGKFKSCNFSPRPINTLINTIVIHHTDMTSAQGALDRLCDKNIGVSSHYLIDKMGGIYHLVNTTERAFHAGASCWRGISNVNDYSIGIELDNNGSEPFGNQQMDSLISLIKELFQKHPIEQRNVVAHADVAPNRKVDPNHHFNWQLLAENNIGIYPNIKMNDATILHKYGMQSADIMNLKQKLSAYGYLIANLDNEFDLELLNVIHAFKRHFCSETYAHTFWDNLADAKLNQLLKII